MANKDIPNGFSFVRSLTGQQAPLSGALAANQTIAKGDALIISSGLIAIALATSGLIWGVAAEDAVSGASPSRDDDRIAFYPAVPGNIFEGQVSGTSAATSIGAEADIEGATGIMEINEDASVEDVVQILALVSDIREEIDIGLNDRVEFHFIRSSFYPVLAAQA